MTDASLEKAHGSPDRIVCRLGRPNACEAEMLTRVLSLAIGSALCASACTTEQAPPMEEEPGPLLPGGYILAPKSGSRLRARVLSGDGARVVVGFHDTSRDEDCTFQPAEPGHTRCLPAMRDVIVDQYSEKAGPDCAVPIVPFPPPFTERYVVTYDAIVCSDVVRRSVRLPAGFATVGYGYDPVAAACVVWADHHDVPYVIIGDEVPWSAFAEATTRDVDRGAYVERIYIAEDGAQAHVGFRASSINADCTFTRLSDGAVRCLPLSSTVETASAFIDDASCPVPLSVGVAPGWAEPNPCRPGFAFFGSAKVNECFSAIDRVLWGDPNDPERSPDGFGCYKRSAAEAFRPVPRVWRRLSDVTASFAPVPPIGTGTGRLIPSLVSVDASVYGALAPEWHDTQLDSDCTFRIAADGKLRCLPVALPTSILYLNARCTAEDGLAGFAQGRGCGITLYRECPVDDDESRLRIFLGGTDVDATKPRFELIGSTCSPLSNEAERITEVDPTTFVEGVVALE